MTLGSQGLQRTQETKLIFTFISEYVHCYLRIDIHTYRQKVWFPGFSRAFLSSEIYKEISVQFFCVNPVSVSDRSDVYFHCAVLRSMQQRRRRAYRKTAGVSRCVGLPVRGLNGRLVGRTPLAPPRARARGPVRAWWCKQPRPSVRSSVRVRSRVACRCTH